MINNEMAHTVDNCNRDTHKALLCRTSSVRRRETEQKDPWDVVEAHEIDSCQRRVALCRNIKRVHHDSPDKTHKRTKDPEDTSKVRNEERDSG